MRLGGLTVWNFYEGPLILGLVPPAFRYTRTQTLLNGSAFAKKIGVNCIVTHGGFIHENPNDAEYAGLINMLIYDDMVV